MSKTLDILMAGVISGIVAYTTSTLGIAGTVIGAVLGSMLYQFMTHVFREPLEDVEPKKIEPEVVSKIVYIFPLLVILAVEVIYLFSSVYWKSEHIFYILEQATGDNLFRSIGAGLLIMGIYPFVEPENIKKEYGYILMGVGAIKLLAGFSNLNTPITNLYSMIYSELGLIISLLVIGALCYVILSIAEDCINTINNRNTSYRSIEDGTWDEGIKSRRNAWNNEEWNDSNINRNSWNDGNIKNKRRNNKIKNHGKNFKNKKKRNPVKIKRRR
jgi:hypothetical protein